CHLDFTIGPQKLGGWGGDPAEGPRAARGAEVLVKGPDTAVTGLPGRRGGGGRGRGGGAIPGRPGGGTTARSRRDVAGRGGRRAEHARTAANAVARMETMTNPLTKRAGGPSALRRLGALTAAAGLAGGVGLLVVAGGGDVAGAGAATPKTVKATETDFH